jgi:hypothetical protein
LLTKARSLIAGKKTGMTDRDASGKFVKGQSGNPTGRAPKEREQRYYDILMTSVTFDDWREIVLKAKDQAKRGDQAARKWLADYLVGPPVERKEITGADGNALKIMVEYADLDG